MVSNGYRVFRKVWKGMVQCRLSFSPGSGDLGSHRKFKPSVPSYSHGLYLKGKMVP
jgi:hypothetical protein